MMKVKNPLPTLQNMVSKQGKPQKMPEVVLFVLQQSAEGTQAGQKLPEHREYWEVEADPSLIEATYSPKLAFLIYRP